MKKQQRVLDIELERLLLGELGEERTEAVTRALEEDSDIKARYLALQASSDAILAQYPPRVMAAEIAARLERKEMRSGGKRGLWLALPAMGVAATAVLLAYLVIPVEVAPRRDERPEEIRIKGIRDPALFVFRKGDHKEELLKNGDEASAGDVIQLRYAARGASHGVILSVDGRGTVTLHFPSDENGSTRIEKQLTHALGFSYELDDAPGFERFFFVTADKPLEVKAILEKARKLGADTHGRLDLKKGLHQFDFVLKKRSRPR